MDILNKGNINDFYHIDDDVLGEGINKVVRGLDINTGEEVAIKIIKTNEMGQNDIEQLFKEIQILCEVSHPNIVKLVQVFEDQHFYLVFELMKGGNLSEIVAENNYLSEEKTAQYLSPVVDALNFCHELGITHRDLKVRTVFENSNINFDLAGQSST